MEKRGGGGGGGSIRDGERNKVRVGYERHDEEVKGDMDKQIKTVRLTF